MQYGNYTRAELAYFTDSAWYSNRTDILEEIHDELVKRGGCHKETCTHSVCSDK